MQMRNATKEEIDGINQYIESISKPVDTYKISKENVLEEYDEITE